MKFGITPTRQEIWDRKREIAVRTQPKPIRPPSAMGFYQPMKDMRWQAVMERVREVQPVSFGRK